MKMETVMKFSVEIDEIMLRSLVLQYLSKSLGYKDRDPEPSLFYSYRE